MKNWKYILLVFWRIKKKELKKVSPKRWWGRNYAIKIFWICKFIIIINMNLSLIKKYIEGVWQSRISSIYIELKLKFTFKRRSSNWL